MNNPDQASADWSATLLRNTIQWLASNSGVELLRFDPVKSGSESVVLRAKLNNEAGEPEENANISIQLNSTGNAVKRYNMEHSRQGSYTLDLGRLPEGKYTYATEARLGDRLLQRSKGAFIITKPSLELANTKRNDQVLQRLSSTTLGFHLNYTELGSLNDSLASAGIYSSKTYIDQSTVYLFNQYWWFIVLLLLLATEWGLRKWKALP
jgi:hypothetical protein